MYTSDNKYHRENLDCLTPGDKFDMFDDNSPKDYLVGKLAERIRLPSLLGMLIFGFLVGPSVFGFLNQDFLAMIPTISVIVLVMAPVATLIIEFSYRELLKRVEPSVPTASPASD